MIHTYEGKTYTLVPVKDNESAGPCSGCAFDRDIAGCQSAPECGTELVFVEAVEVSEEDDFLSGVQACDLSGEGECEACQ